MAAEFETLSLNVVLIDNASKGLDKISEQLRNLGRGDQERAHKRLEGNFKAIGDVIRPLTGDFSKLNASVTGFARTLASSAVPAIAGLGAAIGGIAGAVAVALPILRKFTLEMSQIGQLARETGHSAAVVKEFREQFQKTFGSQGLALADETLRGLGKAMTDVQNPASELRRELQQGAKHTPEMAAAMEVFLGKLDTAAKSGDTIKFYKEAIPALDAVYKNAQTILGPQAAADFRNRMAAMLHIPAAVAATMPKITEPTKEAAAALDALIEQTTKFDIAINTSTSSIGRIGSAILALGFGPDSPLVKGAQTLAEALDTIAKAVERLSQKKILGLSLTPEDKQTESALEIAKGLTRFMPIPGLFNPGAGAISIGKGAASWGYHATQAYQQAEQAAGTPQQFGNFGGTGATGDVNDLIKQENMLMLGLTNELRRLNDFLMFPELMQAQRFGGGGGGAGAGAGGANAGGGGAPTSGGGTPSSTTQPGTTQPGTTQPGTTQPGGGGDQEQPAAQPFEPGDSSGGAPAAPAGPAATHGGGAGGGAAGGVQGQAGAPSGPSVDRGKTSPSMEGQTSPMPHARTGVGGIGAPPDMQPSTAPHAATGTGGIGTPPMQPLSSPMPSARTGAGGIGQMEPVTAESPIPHARTGGAGIGAPPDMDPLTGKIPHATGKARLRTRKRIADLATRDRFGRLRRRRRYQTIGPMQRLRSPIPHARTGRGGVNEPLANQLDQERLQDNVTPGSQDAGFEPGDSSVGPGAVAPAMAPQFFGGGGATGDIPEPTTGWSEESTPEGVVTDWHQRATEESKRLGPSAEGKASPTESDLTAFTAPFVALKGLNIIPWLAKRFSQSPEHAKIMERLTGEADTAADQGHGLLEESGVHHLPEIDVEGRKLLDGQGGKELSATVNGTANIEVNVGAKKAPASARKVHFKPPVINRQTQMTPTQTGPSSDIGGDPGAGPG